MTERLDKEAALSEVEPLNPETESSSFPSRGILPYNLSVSPLARQLSRRESQERSGRALASHFGRGGTAQAVTERARPLADPLASPARKKTKTDTFCRHKRKFHRSEKDVAKSLQKYCKIYYEIHQRLGSTLVQSAKKWNKIGRKEAQIPKSVHLDTCNLRIVSAIMGTSKGSQTRDCFRQKYNRRRIRLPLEDTRVRRPAATAFAHGRCTMKVSEAKQKSWQNRSDPAAQS